MARRRRHRVSFRHDCRPQRQTRRVFGTQSSRHLQRSLEKVSDDDGHILERGARMAVCDKTFQLYKREPYASQIIAVEPIEIIELETAKEFDCRRTLKRSPRETKGLEYDLTDLSGAVCGEGENCC